MSTPSSRIRPAVGCSNPATSRSVVVLPQPDGPSRAKNSPPGTSRSMPSTAATSSNRFSSPPGPRSRPERPPGADGPGEAGEVGQDPVDVLVGVLGRQPPLLGLAPRGQ